MTDSFNPPPPPLPQMIRPQQGPPHFQPPPRSSGSRVWIFVLIGCGGLLALFMLLGFGFLVWVGMNSPDTAVIPGPQVPEKFMTLVRETGVLEDGETVLYFYSDALMDVRDSFYLLTDRKVVLYSNAWEEPAILVPFDAIADLDATWSDSFFVDSSIFIELEDGSVVTVPVSSEYDRDEQFFNDLEERWIAATGGPAENSSDL